jgi:flagellar biosynthesis/type III secretory pathway M-ring protein FliF/YscJ
MQSNPRLAPILARLTPDSVSALVHTLAARQPSVARDNVSVPDILEHLLHGVDLGSPAEAWSARLALQRAIAEAVAQVPDMEYVEGDS